MGNRCSAFIYPQYIAEYQELHKAICLNLNRMIWNIAFLKKAKEAQENGVRCRNDFVISHLYKNEFELLILRLNRTFFDKGQDVITLSRLKDNLFSKYLFPEYKEKLSISLKNITWDTAEVVSARRRLEDTVPTFRNQYIAHSLIGEIDEVSVSFIDSEKVVMAACDLFSRLDENVICFETYASITARPFFEKLGYTVQAENIAVRGGVSLTNFRMTKARIEKIVSFL